MSAAEECPVNSLDRPIKTAQVLSPGPLCAGEGWRDPPDDATRARAVVQAHLLCSRRRSGPGAHQLASPSSFIVAGTSSLRTRVASIATATDRENQVA